MGRKHRSTNKLDVASSAKCFKKTDFSSDSKNDVWTFDERCRLAEALADEKLKKFPDLIKKHIASKSGNDVMNYVNYLKLLESGTVYTEFKEQPAALDVWLGLMEKTTRQGDKIAEQCIPQIMTVAALEPRGSSHENSGQVSPNYSNVYNYLALLLKGDELVDLPPVDAQVALHLLDGLTDKFCKSYTMLQKEFLHEAFGVLTGKENEKKAATGSKTEQTGSSLAGPSPTGPSPTGPSPTGPSPQCPSKTKDVPKQLPSLNPLNVPAVLLEFRKKKQVVFDFSTNWRTTVS